MSILQPEHVDFLATVRRAVLATTASSGVPRLVPICFAVIVDSAGPILCSPLDDKPKRRGDPHQLARVRDLAARPGVTLLADRWDEDWARLAWIRIEASASVIEPGHPEHEPAVGALRARYPQYRTHALETSPIIRFRPTRVAWWSAANRPDL